MDRFRRRSTPNGQIAAPTTPPFADGRPWGPLDVADGRPRLVITEDVVVDDDGNPRTVYHTDSFNIADDAAVRLYLAAGPLMAHRLLYRKENG